jgi:glycosyltransferase involved in cell wall biosynthesis
MPTVLQVLPRLGAGGVERGTVDLARHLVQQGWRALVASEGGALEADLGRAGGLHLKLPLATKNPLGMWWNIGRLGRLIRQHGVDLVHARSRAPAWSAREAAARANVRFVTTFHGVYSGWDRPWKRRYTQILASGERVIAISEFVARHLRETYGVTPDRLRVVHRGVDLVEFDPSRIHGLRIAQLAERWGLDPDSRVILVPGRLSRSKGHGWFLESFARVRRPDTVAVIVGGPDRDGVYPEELARLVQKLGIGDRVRFAGHCQDMPAAYALAEIVAATPIRPEAFGRVSIEAQAMMRPIVAAADGGLPETLRDRVTGWLVPTGDAAALAEVLEEALDLPSEERDDMGRRGRRLVADRFSLERMAASTLQVYEELLGPARISRAA